MDFVSDADPAHDLPGDLRTTSGTSENCAISQFLTDSERHELGLRLDALHFGQVDLVVELSGVSNKRVVLQLLHVVQSDDVEVAR